MQTIDTATTGYIITVLCSVISLLLIWTLSELRAIRKDVKEINDRQNRVDLDCTRHTSDTNQNTRDIKNLERLMKPTRYDLARLFARVDIIDHKGNEIEHPNVE